MSTRWQPVVAWYCRRQQVCNRCQQSGSRRSFRITGRTRGAPAYCSRLSTFGYYTVLVDRSDKHTVKQYTKTRIETSYVDSYWAQMHQAKMCSFHSHNVVLLSYS